MWPIHMQILPNNYIYKGFPSGTEQNSKVYSSEKWGEKLVL